MAYMTTVVIGLAMRPSRLQALPMSLITTATGLATRQLSNDLLRIQTHTN